ncbi:hypothetical protein D3C81_1312340 [compost metagenome]
MGRLRGPQAVPVDAPRQLPEQPAGQRPAGEDGGELTHGHARRAGVLDGQRLAPFLPGELDAPAPVLPRAMVFARRLVDFLESLGDSAKQSGRGRGRSRDIRRGNGGRGAIRHAAPQRL